MEKKQVLLNKYSWNKIEFIEFFSVIRGPTLVKRVATLIIFNNDFSYGKMGQQMIYNLVYTEFILVRLCRKLNAYRHTFESVPGTNQYWALSVKFLAQGNNDLPLTGFEPMRLAIMRLLVRRVNHSAMPPQIFFHIQLSKR
jgi:hypothetical protein